MLARAHTFTVEGLCTRHVTVEVDVRAGLPASRSSASPTPRCARRASASAPRSSTRASSSRRGGSPPTSRRATCPRPGPDSTSRSPARCSARPASCPRERLDSDALLGELGLDGSVEPARGTLAVADAARRAGLQGIALARSRRARGAARRRTARSASSSVSDSAVRVLRGGRGDPLPPAPSSEPARNEPDLADVRGQDHAVRALVIAAAGGHNLLLSGAPGTGKTMLALRAPSILPPAEPGGGARGDAHREPRGRAGVAACAERPPFRAPHHSITAAGLIGGARGDAGRARLCSPTTACSSSTSSASSHARRCEALRQPLEEGRVVIARARHSRRLPRAVHAARGDQPVPVRVRGRARALHVHGVRARAPSPPHRAARCSTASTCSPPSCASEPRARSPPPADSSRRAREQVREARARQRRRLRHEPVSLNAHLDASMLRAPPRDRARRARAGAARRARQVSSALADSSACCGSRARSRTSPDATASPLGTSAQRSR